MKRSERKIYTRCIAVMAVYIISAVYFYTLPAEAKTVDAPVVSKKAVFTDDQSEVDNFTAEDAETDLKTVFDENSAMPCCDRESFEKWMETYEQEQETCEQETEPEPEPTTVPTDECKVTTGTDETPVTFYSVNGETLNPELQAYLYQRLADYQLEWFMPYAIMIAYQESKFDCYAINPVNKVDCGLFQFRSYYYTGTDIFNPYEQIDIFCELMGNRAKMGCDVYEMISRHNVSDWGSYNATYVSQVLAHEQNLREVN